MDTPEDYVKSLYPAAEIVHRDGDGAFVLYKTKNNHFIRLSSKVFLIGTSSEIIWSDAFLTILGRQ